MTFNAAVPLNSDSPAIFPAQNQQNMARLQTLLGADHQFNLSAAADDGYHNLIHMTQQAPTGALASTGRLYVRTTGGLIQLFYMDDAGTEYKVTPFYDTAPQKINGSQVIASSGTVNILNVAYDFNGVGTVFIAGQNSQRSYTILRSGASTDLQQISTNSGANARPTLEFSGTILRVRNNSGSGQNIVWSLIINRL